MRIISVKNCFLCRGRGIPLLENRFDESFSGTILNNRGANFALVRIYNLCCFELNLFRRILLLRLLFFIGYGRKTNSFCSQTLAFIGCLF